MTLDDRYTYPGSDGVLVNRFGIRDPQRLDEALNDYASIAWFELRRVAPPEPPGLEYLRDIHRQMFAPLLEWAGELRLTDAQATGTGIVYARPEYIEESLAAVFGRLEREDYLAGLDASTFADRLADRWGELSAVHPFRDGNTRSQSAYVSAIADRAGHPIDWARVEVPALRELRLQAIVGRPEGLADYLRDRLLDPDSVPATRRRDLAVDSFRIALGGVAPPTPGASSIDPPPFSSTAYRPGPTQRRDLGR